MLGIASQISEDLLQHEREIANRNHFGGLINGVCYLDIHLCVNSMRYTVVVTSLKSNHGDRRMLVHLTMWPRGQKKNLNRKVQLETVYQLQDLNDW